MFTQETVSRVTTSATYGGSAAAGTPLVQKYYLGLAVDEWTLIFGAIGAAVAVLGFVGGLFYQHVRTKAYVKHLSTLDAAKPEEGE